jgi:two-component system, sensor histidine kinase
LLLDVWDTGVGIDAAHMPLIFDEFYQIGNVSRDRRKGMGLGLAIVRRLVDLLEHPLEVASRAGKGTRFRLRLPMAEAVESFIGDTPMPFMSLSGKLALVVDDEPDVRDGMAAALAARGCAVIVASSTIETIAMLTQASSQPDFAVMDYRLETQTGLTALADIRAHLGWHLPALIVTGDTLASDLTRFAATGEAWLIKPVSSDDLQRAVTRLLSPQNATFNP